MAKQNLSRAVVSLHRGHGPCWEVLFSENPVISTKTRTRTTTVEGRGCLFVVREIV